jgi:hypothetical protein
MQNQTVKRFGNAIIVIVNTFFLERKPDVHVCGNLNVQIVKNGILILIIRVICRESD